jgi:hypothetical protein
MPHPPGRIITMMLGCTLAAAGTGILGVAAADAEQPAALTARTISLSENGHLHLTSKHGFTLNEEGRATGTITGTIYIHLHLISNSHVTAEVNIYPTGGSLSGNGSATYHVNGGYASFTGNLTINHATGNYTHTHAPNLRFTGTIQRRNDTVTVQLNGTLTT